MEGRAERFPSGTLVIRDGRIVFATEGVGTLLGRPIEAVVGQGYLDFLSPEDRPRLQDRHERRLRGEPTPQDYELNLVQPDGSCRVVEVHATLDGDDVVLQLRDVSAQAARRPRLEALASLGAAIQRERSEAAIFARVREGLSRLGLTALLMRAGTEGARVEWAEVAAHLRAAFQARMGLPLEGFSGRWTTFSRTVWEEGGVFSDDWGSEVARYMPERAAEVRALIAAAGLSRAVSVRLDEQAGFRFYLVVAGGWLRAEDLAAVRMFGAQIAAALDAARTIADLSRHNADLAALNRIGELVGEAGDLETFFRRADEIVRRTAGCRGLAIFALDEASGEAVLVHDSGAPPEVRSRLGRVPAASAFGEVLRDRLARVVEHGPAQEGLAGPSLLGFRTAAWIPLVARSKAVGVMGVGFSGGPDEVRGRLDLLGAVGAHFASAMESHGLLSDLRRRVAELTLLNDVAVAAAQLDPVLLLENALRRVCETFQAEVASAYMRDGDRLVLVAGVGLDAETARVAAQLALGEGLPGQAVQRLAPVRADGFADADAITAQVAARERVSCALSVPLLAKGQAAVGAITFGRRRETTFTDGEISLLSAIGAQLGVAVENARLFADVRRRLSDLEAVHALALRIFDNAPGDVRGLLDDGCREAARALSCRAALILLAEAGGTRLRGVAGWGAPFEPGRVELDLEADRMAADAIRRRAPAWSEDVTKDPRSAMCGRPGVPPLAMLAVPLTSRTETAGVLFLADDAGRTFTDPELALANALAGELAVGLENARLYDEARRRVEELSLLNEMGRTVAGSLDLDRVLAAGVEAARRLVGAVRGFVVLYEPLTGELRTAAGTGLSRAELPLLRAPLSQGGHVGRVIRDRRPVAVEDAASSPETDEDVRRHLKLGALAAAPILLRGEPLGALVVDDAPGRRFQPAELDRMQAVANQLAVAIENARLYTEARERLAELSTVIDVARVVSSSLDLEEVLLAGAEHLKRTLGGSACTILLDDLRGQELRRSASQGAPIGPARVPLEAPSLAREALEARTPVTGGLAPDGGGPEVALLAVPLHVRDHPVGVALVAGATADRTFSPGELSRAMAIASQLAVAVDNARLYSETRRRAEELGLLHEVGRSLVATLDIEQVLDAGVRNLARMVDAPAALLALVADDAAHVEVRAVSGAPASLLGRRLPFSGSDAGPIAAVRSRHEPLLVEDAAADPRVRADFRDEVGARAFLTLPLLVRDRLIGTAIIVETRGPRRFGPGEVERAAAVANQLAVAAENARLYEDLRRSYADLAHAQRQLIQQERLAALGELSAVVAHEVRNPLGVIFNSLGSLRRLLRPQGDARLLLDIVGEEADRLNRIVGDLLDFARPSTPVLRPEPLERVVEEAVQAALAQNPAGVEISREREADLPPVPIDARLVRQAVLNVAVNAVQAMPRGGRLTVRTRRDAEAALLEIEDTGAGIPEEVRSRIFEPFFTTKASGTGLGLAVVKRIVDGHGGEIDVRSRPGAGTVFCLRFPLAPAPPADGVEKEATLG